MQILKHPLSLFFFAAALLAQNQTYVGWDAVSMAGTCGMSQGVATVTLRSGQENPGAPVVLATMLVDAEGCVWADASNHLTVFPDVNGGGRSEEHTSEL